VEIFFESDYREVIKKIFASRQHHGHGQASRLARHLNVNTTLVSQALSGKKHFTEEQVVKTAEFLDLNKKEAYYFLLLAQIQRTHSEELKELLHFQLRQIQTEAKSIKGRVSPKAELALDEQAVYYSAWFFSAIHTLVSIPGFDTPKKISAELSITLPVVQAAIERLIEYGLIINSGGKLKSGPVSTYIAPESPLVLRHHQNWRQVAGLQVQQREPADFYFTAPMSISEVDFRVFRTELTTLLSKLYKIVEASKPEKLVCLNIDFFKL
jgi:uncharacterized protein (TIGR02147 family)